MPKLVTCIKKCFYGSILLTFILTITSLFVWQAEVYQNTIEEQVSSMKSELSSMKKENHLLEIKLNEQFGKHDDLKEEFRYLVKQAKWSALGVREENNKEEKEAIPIIPLKVRQVKEEVKRSINKVQGVNLDNLLQQNAEKEEEGNIDFSKRETFIIVSETGGGAQLLGSIFDQNEQVFYLPAVSGASLNEAGVYEIRHCNIAVNVINYYKKNPDIAARSSSLAKFCSKDRCEGLSTDSLRKECTGKEITVLSGSAEHLTRALITSFEIDTLYVARDPRALISSSLSRGTLTEERVQDTARRLCARINTFIQRKDSHYKYKYQVIKYEKLAASPRSVLAQIYHTFLDNLESSSISLSKETKSKLFTTISSWKSSMTEIVLDAVLEECGSIIEMLVKL